MPIHYRFFALSWKAPQEVDSDYRENLRRKYTKELQLLLHSLPSRFHQITQKCLDSMSAIMSLPMVLLHQDFNDCNIMVDETSCHLTGVIDWAEAEIGPFGQNLYILCRLLRVHSISRLGGGDMKLTAFYTAPSGAPSETKWETYLQKRWRQSRVRM